MPTFPPRIPRHRYIDPLDRIWLACASRAGFRVVRDEEVYASSDGRGTITLGAAGTLDPDDSLAQLIFHELCHALVEGPEAHRRPDWGLDNFTDRDEVREFAALRLQAALAAPYGLRRFLAPTTDFRAYFDALGPDPLRAPVGDGPGLPGDPAVIAATRGAVRAEGAPWTPHLFDALAATALVVRAAAAAGEAESELPSLYGVLEPESARHASGFWMARAGSPAAGSPAAGSPAAEQTCGSCGWLETTARGARCRKADGKRVEPDMAACERWEGGLDCQDCGACCREAYDSVTVSRRDPVVKAHPGLIVRREGYLEVQRAGERCAALEGGRAPGEVYACRIYPDRPRCCRALELGSVHCLWARRRVGLSR